MNRIKELISQKNISQKELANILNVSQPTISDWINDRKAPAGKRLADLSEALNVSTDYLLGRTDDPAPPSTRKSPVYDDEALELMEEMHKRPELKVLFSTSKRATKKDIEFADQMLKRMARESGYSDYDD